MRRLNEADPGALFAFPPREARIERLRRRAFDVLVVGGGITGLGAALDLRARGLDVALIEAGDYAGATSSASSRLIHGGLRYLEHGQIGLVRESCLERSLLLDLAAGYVRPERFCFPVRRGDRIGRARLFAGLWLYHALSVPHALGMPRLLGARAALDALPLLDPATVRGAGVYVDAATHDARLALAVAKTASAHGALIVSRAELDSLQPEGAAVLARVADRLGGATFDVRARRALLAGGPYCDGLRARAGLAGALVHPTRGSHVVLDRARLPVGSAVTFTAARDGRVLFVLPWAHRTIIGTTDLDAGRAELAGPVRAARAEVNYLLDAANALFPAARLVEDDVLATWSGLRPLLASGADAPSARSREEKIARDGAIYTITGGKLTGYRAMAERVGARICRDLGTGDGSGHSPTRSLRLHGAISTGVPPRESAPGEGDAGLREALRRRHGAEADAVRAYCAADPGRAATLDAETLAGEIDHAVLREDAFYPSDVLLRRTDAGYVAADEGARRFAFTAERIARLRGLDATGRAALDADAAAALGRLHGWREDPPP